MSEVVLKSHTLKAFVRASRHQSDAATDVVQIIGSLLAEVGFEGNSVPLVAELCAQNDILAGAVELCRLRALQATIPSPGVTINKLDAMLSETLTGFGIGDGIDRAFVVDDRLAAQLWSQIESSSKPLTEPFSNDALLEILRQSKQTDEASLLTLLIYYDSLFGPNSPTTMRELNFVADESHRNEILRRLQLGGAETEDLDQLYEQIQGSAQWIVRTRDLSDRLDAADDHRGLTDGVVAPGDFRTLLAQSRGTSSELDTVIEQVLITSLISSNVDDERWLQRVFAGDSMLGQLSETGKQHLVEEYVNSQVEFLTEQRDVAGLPTLAFSPSARESVELEVALRQEYLERVASGSLDELTEDSHVQAVLLHIALDGLNPGLKASFIDNAAIGPDSQVRVARLVQALVMPGPTVDSTYLAELKLENLSHLTTTLVGLNDASVFTPNTTLFVEELPRHLSPIYQSTIEDTHGRTRYLQWELGFALETVNGDQPPAERVQALNASFDADLGQTWNDFWISRARSAWIAALSHFEEPRGYYGDRRRDNTASEAPPFEAVDGSELDRGKAAVTEALARTRLDVETPKISPDEFQVVHHGASDVYTVILPGVTDLKHPEVGLNGIDRSVRDLDAAALDSTHSTLVKDNVYARYVREYLMRDLPPGSKVMLNGHSYGADTALDLAADAEFSQYFDVTHVMATGYHSQSQLAAVGSLNPGTEVLVLQNRSDVAVIAEQLNDLALDGPSIFSAHENHRVERFFGGFEGFGHHQNNYIAHVTTSGDGDWFYESVAVAGYGESGSSYNYDISFDPEFAG